MPREPVPEKLSVKKEKHTKENPRIIENKILLNGLSIRDSEWVKVINCEIVGEVGLYNDYPEDHKLAHIYFENCQIRDSFGARLVMMGGHHIHDIYFTDTIMERNCQNGTHVVYMTGAHWNKRDKDGNPYPPVRNVHFKNCHIAYTPGGRHCLQFNGRFDNVSVENCVLIHGHLGAISSIGVQNGKFHNNLMYGCNRTPFVLYDYASHWASHFNYFQTDEDIDAFLKTHHPNQNIQISNNTIITGPKMFMYKAEDPIAKGHCIEINNAVHSGFTHEVKVIDPETGKWILVDYEDKQFNYPSKNIYVVNNILYSPKQEIIYIHNAHEASETHLIKNLSWCPPEYKDKALKVLGHNPGEINGNMIDNPHFADGLPQYDFVENYKSYDWKRHPSKFNSFSRIGRDLGIGCLR